MSEERNKEPMHDKEKGQNNKKNYDKRWNKRNENCKSCKENK